MLKKICSFLNLNNKVVLLFRLAALFVFFIPQAYAGTKYDSGKFSNVVKFGNTIIEVHKSGVYDTLWYKIGAIQGNNKVQWGNSNKYGMGTSPSIAIAGNNIIEVHQSHEKSTSKFDQTPLYYRVGTLSADKQTIQWGNTLMYYPDGLKPSLSVSENNIVEVHQVPHLYYIDTTPIYDDKGQIIGYNYEYRYYNTVHYGVGVLENNKTIRWLDAGSSEQSINHTAIASSGDIVVETHQDGTNQSIWYQVGIIQDNKIEWGLSTHYALGSSPSISISGNTIVSRHNCFNSYKLCYGVGVVNKDTKIIEWGSTELSYDTGVSPSIVVEGNTLFESHKSEYFNSLYYNLGIINTNTKEIRWNGR